MESNRFLQGCIAIETRNARLNGSSKEVENIGSNTVENIAYTKKIRSRDGVFPYASGPWGKLNIKKFAKMQGHNISTVISEKTTQAFSEGNPYKNYDEDVMGFMNAGKISISESEFNDLSEEEQNTFTKITKGKGNKKTVIYEKNITKKRKARLMISPLQAIASTRITQEFNTRKTNNNSLLYSREVYSCKMSMGFNLDIDNVGVFSVIEDNSGYKDYSMAEADALGLKYDDNGIIVLEEEVRKRRIKDTLRAIQFLNTNIGQTNNLEDLNSKFVILAEYSIGNNIFNNIFRKGTLDIEYLKEAIEENEEFRLSKIYIGVRRGFMKVDNKDLKDVLIEEFEDYPHVVIGTVGEAFDNYIKTL